MYNVKIVRNSPWYGLCLVLI